MKKVAVIGFGFMGVTHTLNILKSKNLELVAIVDKNPAAIEKGMYPGGNLSTGKIEPAKLNKVNRYSTLDACLQAENLDAVHICVHTDLHYETAKKALQHGVHVLIEKPFCLDVRQGEELIALAKEKNLVLMVAHVVRFMSPYRKLKEWIDQEKYGKLKFLSLSRFSGTPEWGQWREKQNAFGVSGGALFDLVIHDIDFTLHILGNPCEINSYYLPGKLSRHDYINAIWEYPDKDVKVKIEGGNIFYSNFPFQANFMVQFEQASICYSTLSDSILISDNEMLEEVRLNTSENGYYNEIAYFSRCIEKNSSPLECTPESSLETIKICYRHI
jgi:predicted dehydrogenase